MPIMCTVQIPEGKSRKEINKVMKDISKILMEDFHTGEREVRVTITELPQNRYIAGGVMAYEMPAFHSRKEGDK